MKRILLIFLLFPTISFCQWTQFGSNSIIGSATDLTGRSVSIDGTGTIVAVGSPKRSFNAMTAGCIGVWQNNGSAWINIGDICGEATDDEFGRGVSLNLDGDIIAIGGRLNDGNGSNSGHVRVYQNNSGTWTQIGSDIDGQAIDDQSGLSVSLNDAGNIVAIGSRLNDTNGVNSGQVRVYEDIAGTWTQLGTDINGEAAGDLFGYAVELNANGNILVAGAPGNDGNASNAGHTRVYQNISGAWIQIGSDIDGTATNDQAGYAVSINDTGDIIAFGSPNSEISPSQADLGKISVYQNVSGTWTQLGSNLYGEAGGNFFGRSVSLNSSGTILAGGAPYNTNTLNAEGQVSVYEFSAGNWTQIGSDINGGGSSNAHDGTSVSLNSSGNTVVSGAPDAQGGGNAKIYRNSNVLGIVSLELNTQFYVYPNPAKERFSISTTKTLNSIKIYDLQGKLVKEFNPEKSQFDVSDLNSGLYILKCVNNQGEIIKKLIVE